MNNTAHDPDHQPDHELPVGEILRRYRVHYGQSLEQVEFALRIRAEQLQALERGDTSKLPGRVYAIGFVRTYSEYLGLDANHMVHLFKTQSIGNKPKTELSFPVSSKESQSPSMPLVSMTLGGAFILLLVWFLFFYTPANKEEIIPELDQVEASEITKAPPIGFEPTVTETSETAETQVQDNEDATVSLLEQNSTSEETETQSILQPVKQPEGVILRIEEKSWIEVRDSTGKVVLSQILNAGDEYTVPEGGQGYKLTTGNAGGMSIIVNGKEVPKLGRPAQVRRNVSLNPDDLI